LVQTKSIAIWQFSWRGQAQGWHKVESLECRRDGPASSSAGSSVYPEQCRPNEEQWSCNTMASSQLLYKLKGATFSNKFSSLNNPWHKVNELQYTGFISINYATGMLAFIQATLFPLAIISLFCCRTLAYVVWL
jgi:hypothetical protein